MCLNVIHINSFCVISWQNYTDMNIYIKSMHTINFLKNISHKMLANMP